MDNRFLKRLQLGLVDLQKNPSDQEVAGIPRSSFEIFVRIFRHGLPPDLQKNLPAHNLADKEYLRLLVLQVDSFLQKPAEAEKVLANMPPLKNLELVFQKARETQNAAVAQHQTWQTTFEQQSKQYNLDLIRRLDKKLQEEFPSLAEEKNSAKRKMLVADMAETIQRQGLPYVKGDYQAQARDVVEKVVQTTIRHYATEIEDLQTEEIESKPQAREEKIITISQKIAQEEADPAFAIRRGQIRAEGSPTEDPTYKVGAAIETSVIANLPPELAQNKELIDIITGEIEMQIHQGPQDVSQIVQNVLARKNVQRKIAAAKIAFSTAQQQKFIDSVSPEIAPIISEIVTSPQFGQTPFAGSGASFAPGGGPVVAPPVPPVAAITPPTPPPTGGAMVSGPTGSIIPGVGGASASVVGYVAKGDPLEILQASGSPLHFLTALTSPTSAVDFGKYLITAGPIRSGFWFAWESFGLAKPDYLKIGLFGLDRMQYDLDSAINELTWKLTGTTSASEKYELGLEIKEVNSRLGFVNKIFDGIHQNPGLDQAYKLFFGEQGKVLGIDTSNWIGPFKNMSFGAYHFLHPWQAITMRLYNNHVLLGLGVDGIFGSLSAYAKYGGYGGAYVTQEYLKMFGTYLVKAAGVKLGLYEIVGQGLHRRYVFKPLYQAQLWIKRGISSIAKATVHAAAVQLSKTTIGKAVVGAVIKIATWIGTRLGTLISGIASFIGVALLVWDAVKIVWEITKKMIKWVGGALLVLLVWIFSNFNPLEILASLGGGGLFAFLPFTPAKLLLGIWGYPVDFILGTGGTALTIQGIKALFGNIGSLFGKGLSFGGNILTNLLHLPSLGGMVFPVLVTTGSLLAGGYFYSAWIIQSGFALLQFPQIQSEHILVQKDIHPFSGKLGQETIKYTLTVGPKKIGEKLINIKISDTTNSSCANTPPAIAERNFVDKIPADITFANPLTIDYEVPTDNGFNDCLITNTATVTADIENGPTGEQSFYTAGVTIGNPPVDLPSGWPVAAGCITQGPNGADSHSGFQAIDISGLTGEAILGTEAFATHKGTVSLTFRNHAKYGNYVIVNGSAEKGGFQTLYAHLETIAVARGQEIIRGTKIGSVGNTGNSTARHLHYEFRGLKMGTPYLPVSIPACVGRKSEGGTCEICF